ISKHGLQPADSGKCLDLDTALLTAATNGGGPRILASQIFRRYRGRRTSSQRCDVTGVHHSQWAALFGIAQNQDSLNSGQPESLRVLREIPVHLGAKVRPAK